MNKQVEELINEFKILVKNFEERLTSLTTNIPEKTKLNEKINWEVIPKPTQVLVRDSNEQSWKEDILYSFDRFAEKPYRCRHNTLWKQCVPDLNADPTYVWEPWFGNKEPPEYDAVIMKLRNNTFRISNKSEYEKYRWKHAKSVTETAQDDSDIIAIARLL